MKCHRLSTRFVAVIAAAILSIPCQTFAGTIVDTGPGDSITAGAALYPGGPQRLAGKFSVTSATTINSVEGWIGQHNLNSTGSLTISVGLSQDIALFSGTISTPQLGRIAAQWTGLTGLNWSLAAGDYWVTFAGNGGFDGFMPYGAPNPLIHYSYNNSAAGWFDEPSLDFGVRITGIVAPSNAIVSIAVE